MIRTAWRRLIAFLVSAPLAVGLLIFVGAWSLVATAVPQGPSATPSVTQWSRSHALVEPVIRALGLHHAFTSWIFLAAVLLLGISTVICSWRRTKVALERMVKLRAAARVDRGALVARHELEVPVDSRLSEGEALSIVSATLRRLGIKVTADKGTVRSVSGPWSVWGSAVFHWALVALIAAVLLGQLWRFEGSILLAVGQTKPNVAASFTQITAGPLHSWAGEHRSVRLDAFEPDFTTGGIDRGAVPTVSLLDSTGGVIVKQRVYQNKMLHDGALSINAPDLGLAVRMTLLNAQDQEVGRSIEYVNFSQETSGGTYAVNDLSKRDSAGRVEMRLIVTVPLEGKLGHYGEWIPRAPKARVLVVSGSGATVLDSTVPPGTAVALPGGGAVRIDGIDWYSRLSVVEDPSIPFIYATMIIAAIGLAMTLMFRQHYLVAAVADEAAAATLVMNLRLWRNVPTSREELIGELSRSLAGPEEEETP